MKKYIAIAVVVVTCLAAIAYAYILDSRSTPATEATSTSVTSSTAATPSGDSSDQNDEVNEEDAAIELPKDTSAYVEFDAATFRASADHTRLLFFYSQEHTPSQKLDTLLEKQIDSLEDTVYIFRVDFAQEKELARDLSVDQPGTVLKYENDDQLTGVYTTPDTPTMRTFREILELQ